MFTLTPERRALPEGQDCELNVLLRAEAPPADSPTQRQPIAVTFVVDNSFCMSELKLEMARLAMSAFVEALQEGDRLSLVTVHDDVEVQLDRLTAQTRLQHLRLQSQPDDRALLKAWQCALRQLGRCGIASRRIVVLRSPRGGWDPSLKGPFCQLVAAAREQGVVTSAMGFLQEHRSVAEDLAQAGGGNYYRLEQRSPFAALARLERCGQTLCPVGALKVMVECPEEVELSWITLASRWEPLDHYRPVQKLMRLKIPAGYQGPLLRGTFGWTQSSNGQRVDQELAMQLPRLPVQEWARLAPEPEVQAQSLRHEFLSLVFGYTRWWEPANSPMRARLSQVLEAAGLPLQERQAMRFLADLSLKKTILDDDIADRLHGFYDIFFSQPVWSPRLRTAQEDELKRQAGSLSEAELYRRRMALNRGFDHEVSPRPWHRVEGMLVGLFQGQDTEQTAATLAYLASPGMSPGDAFRHWRAREVMHPSPNFARLLRSLQAGPECGQLCRVAAGLLPYCHKPQLEKMWCDIAALALLTDPDPRLLSASFGVAHLLWEALLLPTPPDPGWYLKTFLAHPTFHAKSITWPQTQDFTWLTQRLQEARSGCFRWPEAVAAWSPFDDLPQVVAGWLYLLELHGAQPLLALEFALNEPGGLAALTGAALGAVHGTQSHWSKGEELAKLLHRSQDQWF